ncbi:MAG: 3-deoxy-manno-octulosonate cytidylyltransferase [Thermodesulfobacteriota bacterium]|jgi:3-deoxy-manno-octulosonate cytidylyltransferase (CMP-KDO synthetase)
MDSLHKAPPKVVAIIPARYHSSRFEGKPLAHIMGRPMIEHVYTRAAKVPLIARTVVATDDERIAECVRAFGGEVVMTRPDHLSGTDRLAEAASLLDIAEQDVVVNIQGDQPLFDAAVVSQVASPLLDDPGLPMATLIYQIVRPEEIVDPNHVKTVFDRHGNALYFSRSTIPYLRNPEEGVPAYYKHLGFYAYRKGFLLTFVGLPEGEWERCEKLEQLRALEYGYTIRVVLTEHDSVEVDTPKDLLRVEELIRAGAE